MKEVTFALALFFALNLSAQINENPLITTTGTSTVYAPPDEILLNFTVNMRSMDVKEARKKNAEISRKAIAFLKTEGIADVHVQTQRNSIRPVYKNRFKTGKEDLDYFEASQSINICIKKLEDFDAIFDGLLELGIKKIGNPIFRNSEIRKYEDQARKAAVLAAREKAKLLAETLDQSIGKAHSIKEKLDAPRFNANSYSENTAPEGDDNAKLSFAPGQLEIRASVEVAFELK